MLRIFRFSYNRPDSVLNYLSLFCLLLVHENIFSQDTFSICAVDSITGEVGSAGATCITSSGTSAIIISDVHPGVGVIHTQASWLSANQAYARSLMNMGIAPSAMIDSLIAHDVQNNPSVRQYGIVDRVNGIHAASYTGVNCLNYKNHITGPNYSIQGNILLGQQILDSMESRFLNTQGSLACKLMAALQGAKVTGADTRCTSYGISSFSSFMRVALPSDTAGSYLLDISVNTYPSAHDPIDSLQVLFDQWGGCNQSFIFSADKRATARIFPNPANESIRVELNSPAEKISLFDVDGSEIRNYFPSNELKLTCNIAGVQSGIYLMRIKYRNGEILSTKVIVF
jgi:uncharacterized Ntn-hydrolase superfamily protein